MIDKNHCFPRTTASFKLRSSKKQAQLSDEKRSQERKKKNKNQTASPQNFNRA